jgi:hypothetical protein
MRDVDYPYYSNLTVRADIHTKYESQSVDMVKWPMQLYPRLHNAGWCTSIQRSELGKKVVYQYELGGETM